MVHPADLFRPVGGVGEEVEVSRGGGESRRTPVRGLRDLISGGDQEHILFLGPEARQALASEAFAHQLPRGK